MVGKTVVIDYVIMDQAALIAAGDRADDGDPEMVSGLTLHCEGLDEPSPDLAEARKLFGAAIVGVSVGRDADGERTLWPIR